MEGRHVAVLAVRPRAHVVAQHAEVGDAADAEVVEAVRHIVVLAPGLPRRPEVLAALAAACRVGIHGLVREDLDGSEHHGEIGRARHLVAVHHVDVLSVVRAHVIPHAVGDEHGVGIHLQGPVVVAEALLADDLVPGLHEEQGVRRGAVLRDAHRGSLDLDGEDLLRAVQHLAQADHAIREQRVPVAAKDAGAESDLLLQKSRLVARRLEQREAVEGGPALEGEPDALRADGRAAGGLVVVVRVRGGGAGAHGQAVGPVLVLAVALHVHAEAALGLEAVLGAGLRAGLGHPLPDLAQALGGLDRGFRRAGADEAALPGLLVPGRHQLALLAGAPALGPEFVLLVALVSGLLAARRRAAIHALRRALLRHPGRRALRDFAQGLAGPRVRPLVEKVRACGALHRAMRVVGVLGEAPLAGGLAALGRAAVLPARGARLRAARRPGADGRAVPGRRRDLVRRVRARVALGAALRPEGVLEVALHAGLLAALGLAAVVALGRARVLRLHVRASLDHGLELGGLRREVARHGRGVVLRRRRRDRRHLVLPHHLRDDAAVSGRPPGRVCRAHKVEDRGGEHGDPDDIRLGDEPLQAIVVPERRVLADVVVDRVARGGAAVLQSLGGVGLEVVIAACDEERAHLRRLVCRISGHGRHRSRTSTPDRGH
mmetsp:Transcript_28156/g.83896  ORF Transcript_28156/g.83896 Transcript_28156/m.83896 type:complete len:660 (+) Transcript_28156:230-2209(+)